MSLHVSFRMAFTFLVCADFFHTGHAYPAVENRAVVLSTVGLVPHWLLLNFLKRLLRASTFFQVYSRWNLYVKERSGVTPRYVVFSVCSSMVLFQVMLSFLFLLDLVSANFLDNNRSSNSGQLFIENVYFC